MPSVVPSISFCCFLHQGSQLMNTWLRQRAPICCHTAWGLWSGSSILCLGVTFLTTCRPERQTADFCTAEGKREKKSNIFVIKKDAVFLGGEDSVQFCSISPWWLSLSWHYPIGAFIFCFGCSSQIISFEPLAVHSLSWQSIAVYFLQWLWFFANCGFHLF